MNRIFIEENFLSERECDYLIDFHHRTREHSLDPKVSYYHRDTKITLLNGFYSENDYIRYLLTKLSFFAQSCYNKDVYLDYAEIVEWEGDSLPAHKDYSWDVMTSIVYLNDDFEGGGTFIDDVVVSPKKGKIVCFNGGEVTHGVRDFTNKRYTIASWFGDGKYIRI